MTWKHVSTATVLMPAVVGLEKPARVVSEHLPVRHAVRGASMLVPAPLPLNYGGTSDGFLHSVLKACAGCIEAARTAGINPARPAATIKVDTATAKTPVSIALISYSCDAT